jgi:succinyl-diaminopimelate desuccinylase
MMTLSVVDTLDRDAEEVVALTRRLVQFKTVNPPGDEEEAVRYLGAHLARAGLAVEYQPVAPSRANLIARLAGRGERGHLVLSGHMDVVPADEPGWTCDPFAAERRDGRLVGRGTADMKGGLAAMAVAVAGLARAGFAPRGDLILTATSGEEQGMVGARHLATSGALTGSTGLVIGEPTGLQVCVAQRGALIARLSVQGRAAHSSLPDLGVSAISYMARAVVALETHPFPYRPHDLLGAPVVNVGTIEGGVAFNIVPDRCAATVMFRLVAGQEPDDVAAEVRRVLDAVARASGLAVTVEWEPLGAAAALETDADQPLAQAAAAAVREASGAAPVLRAFTGGTEAGHLCHAYGMPMVIVGPGRLEDAHAVNESVAVAELQRAVCVYGHIARALLA